MRTLADWVAIVIVGLLALVVFGVGSAHAEIPEDKAVKAILGEAGPSYAERLAIACALLNRGTLKGVYGHLSHPSASQYQEGSRAWNEAKDGPDRVFGASYWLSDWDLKHCKPSLTKFRFKMVETAYIVHTHFYKGV